MKKKKEKIKNPVAKFVNTVNKPATHRDKTKYHRSESKKALKSEGFFMSVFLDDERNPDDVTWMPSLCEEGDVVVVVRTPKEFRTTMESLIEKGALIRCVSFDHDIQAFESYGKETTGYDLLKWMVVFCIMNDYNIPQCRFHTMNPVGRDAMERYYKNAVSYQKENSNVV